MNTVQEFKDKGYETELIYIGLPSVDQALGRVRMRVDQGGHSVSQEDIRSNYIEGLENTLKHIEKFDRAVILDNAVKDKANLPKTLAKYQKGKIIQQAMDLPHWAEKIGAGKESLLPKKKKRLSKGKKL